MMTLTMDEAVDLLCPKACTQCGERLPRPGEECAACGELPGLLRDEAAEQLARPGELARMQAEHHRDEAQRLLAEQVEQLLEGGPRAGTSTSCARRATGPRPSSRPGSPGGTRPRLR